MSIKDNLKNIKSTLPKQVTLVAVSKTKPISDVLEAYNAGQRIFGENKIQEMAAKYEALPKDISWHMIGHVQKNKVKYMASFVSLIHGVENLKLLEEINKQALKHDRIIDCLLQIKIASEDSKFGMTPQDASFLLLSKEFSELKNIRVMGLMGMATFTEDEYQIRKEFSVLKNLFDELSQIQKLETLSMGMSDDFADAILEGATLVRIGSALWEGVV